MSFTGAVLEALRAAELADVPCTAPGPRCLPARAVMLGGRLVIAAGGKTVRGAESKDGKPRTWSRP